jgi:phytoene synthase
MDSVTEMAAIRPLVGFGDSASWAAPRHRDLAACEALLRGGSRSFHAASRLLPRQVRQAATSLYAFCRLADDAIDNAGATDRGVAVAGLQRRLAAIYAGRPADQAADRAFAAVVELYGIPKTLPAALLEGFDWDARGRRYATIDGLMDYAARVAGTVGAMMTLVMGVRDASVLARACELGMAMQLTNIARDVGEDARLGRIYLPIDWLAAEGIDPDAFLAAPVYCAGVQAVVRRLLAYADALYAQAADGIAHLPPGCRPAIHGARLLYAAIGHRAGAIGFDPVVQRAVVPGRTKLALLLRALAASAHVARPLHAVPPRAVWGLIAAAAAAPAPRKPRALGTGERFIWAMEMFAVLDARQRASS